MAKKTLNEAVVRRFQKLANVGALNEMYGMREEEEDDAMADAEMADADAAMADDAMADDAMADESAGMDVEITNEEADILIQLGEKLSGAMAGEEEGMPTDDFEEEEEEEEEEIDNPEAAIMEALRGISYTPSKNEVVNEVAKRVAKRLKTAKLHEAKLNRALGRK